MKKINKQSAMKKALSKINGLALFAPILTGLRANFAFSV